MPARDVQREDRVTAGGDGVHGSRLHSSGSCGPLDQALGIGCAADGQSCGALYHCLTACMRAELQSMSVYTLEMDCNSLIS